MIEFIVIEVIAMVALVYGLLLSLIHVGSIYEMSLAFIWTLLISLAYAMLFTKHKVFRLLALLLFFPIYYITNWWALAFFLLTGTMIIFHIELNIFKQSLDYNHVVKSSYKLLLALLGLWLFLSAFTDDFLSRNLQYSWPFIMGYLLISVVLVRTQRHMDAGLPMVKIRKSNLTFFFASMVLLIGLMFEEARKTLFRSINIGIETVVEFLLRPIYSYFADYELYMSSDEVEMGLEASGEVLSHGLESVAEQAPFFKELSEAGYDWTRVMADTVEKVLYVLVLLGILLGLYLLSRKVYKRKPQEVYGQSEERSFVFNPKSKNIKEMLKTIFTPKTPLERIRYFYKKHLISIEKLGESIEPNNTTFDVLTKAQRCGLENADQLRKIYLEARYGEKDVTSDHLEAMNALKK